MARMFVKFMFVSVTFTVSGTLLYVLLYKSEDRQTSPKREIETVNTFVDNNNDKRNSVINYNLSVAILEINGNFSSFELPKTKAGYIKGVSNLKKKATLLNEKLESSAQVNRRRFPTERQARDVRCDLLIKGDNNETDRAVKLSEHNPKVAITPQEYIKMTTNCSRYISERGYITDSLTEVEKQFPISFSILMYTDVEQSERLLRAIYRPQNTYCIHVDSKSSGAIFNAMTNIAGCFENVFLCSKRYDVRWGTKTVLEPELVCMEELWNKSKAWKYFINLTGQEFPLKTNYELVQIFKAYNGANDIEGIVARANKERWKNAGKPPHGIVPVKGAVHIAVSRGYVGFILHDQRARDFLDWTRHTHIPDETFFATLNHNPNLGVPGSYKGSPETEMMDKPYVARFKNWGAGHHNWPCKGKWVRNICVFGIGDLPLLASRRELFANKFVLDHQYFALDCIEELLFNKTRDEYLGKFAFDNEWYSKLGFVSNKVNSVFSTLT